VTSSALASSPLSCAEGTELGMLINLPAALTPPWPCASPWPIPDVPFGSVRLHAAAAAKATAAPSGRTLGTFVISLQSAQFLITRLTVSLMRTQ